MNMGTFLDERVAKYGDLPFIQFYGETVSYARFGDRVNRLAYALKKLGFKKGDFIHVLVENSPQTLASYFAIQKIGAVAGPINGWWKAAEIQYLLNDSKGRGLIIEDQYLPVLKEIRGNCPALEIVIEVGKKPDPSHISFTKLMDESDQANIRCTSEPDDEAYIFYTSGTTGNPKGVLLTHKNVFADVEGISKALNLEDNGCMLIFLPLFHVNAMLTSTYCISSGHQMVLRKKFSASEFWEVVDKYKVNFWSAVPAVYQILLTDPGRQKYDLSSLKFGICGAAPLTEETMKSFEKTFGIPIVEGYGLTEATCVSTINPRDGVRKVGSIGLALTGQKIKLLDDDGNEVQRGEPGEICIGGDVVMKGYFNRPEETAEAIVDGYLRTGDIAVQDEDGYFFIVDRKKDMIIRGGENIYPKEIDNLLASHPKIQEAATIGVPDKTMGEEVKAFVIPLDESLTEEEVIDYCKKNLAEFKVPRYVEILEEDFPRSPIGKVLKKELRKWGLEPRAKKKGPQVTVEDIFATMESRIRPEGIAGIEANYGYVITGSGGGEWTVGVHNGEVKVMTGILDPNVTTTISARDWIDITLGKLDGMTAFSSGRMKVEGEMGLLMHAPKFFKKYTPPKPAPEATVEDIFGTMEARVRPEGVKGVDANYGYVITGSGGGEWTVSVHDDTVKVLEGLRSPNVTSTCSAKDWIAITLGTLDGMTAFTSGRLKVEGEMGLLMNATKFFKKYTPSGAEQEEAKEELIMLPQVLSIPQRFSTGPVMGKFLNALKEKKILANKCPSCGRLQLPPREVCAECRVRVDEFVEVGPLGNLTHSIDITYYASPDPLTGEVRETPYCSAHILLDGCKGHETFWHEVKIDDMKKLVKGARVRPVWSEERRGVVKDIKYFEVID
jgi:long-chain acyl-CoA synthetase